jgi:hypothetical protein
MQQQPLPPAPITKLKTHPRRGFSPLFLPSDMHTRIRPILRINTDFSTQANSSSSNVNCLWFTDHFESFLSLVADL